tara:strand:+ start:83 stop:313 length:231 start_codon:yes stop_codon:yes gene_type:complete
MNIDLKSTKIELAQFILNSKNAALIQKINDFIKSESNDFWTELSDSQKQEVEISRKQILNGETENWESLRNRLNEN